MSHRFFIDSPPSDNWVDLKDEQAHHARNVMRLGEGDEVVLFDGSGNEYVAIIHEAAKKRLKLKISQTTQADRRVDCQITLAVALPKGDRQKFLVEKLVELGCEHLVPLKTARSVAVANAKVISRLQKQVIEASKQCRRNTLMTIGEEQTIEQFAQSRGGQCQRFIADPYDGQPVSTITSANLDSVAVLIGPEGGFDAQEIQLAQALGFSPIRLGPAILRVETAAIAVAAILGVGQEK